MNSFQRSELAFPLLEIERQLAKQRQTEAGEKFGRGKNRLAPNDPKLSEGTDLKTSAPNDAEVGKAVEIVARKANVSSKTFERAKTIIEEGTKERKELVREGC